MYYAHFPEEETEVLRCLICSSDTYNRNKGETGTLAFSSMVLGFIAVYPADRKSHVIIHHCAYLQNGELSSSTGKTSFLYWYYLCGLMPSSFLWSKDHLLRATRWGEVRSEQQQLEKVTAMPVPRGSEFRGSNRISVNLNRMKILKSVFVHYLLIFTLPEIKLQVYFAVITWLPWKSTFSKQIIYSQNYPRNHCRCLNM